jgi:hypothetical protein
MRMRRIARTLAGPMSAAAVVTLWVAAGARGLPDWATIGVAVCAPMALALCLARIENPSPAKAAQEQ